MKLKTAFVVISLIVFNQVVLSAQCASGTATITSVTATNGTGSNTDPATGNITVETCFKLTGFFESSTNWVHGIFVPWNEIPAGFTVVKGATGEQVTQQGFRYWTFFDSTAARNLGLPGPGYYVDNLDGNPKNNYGDNGTGTPKATFANLVPFCFKYIYTCGLSNRLRPRIAVSGDGTTGPWNNPDCQGDYFYSTGGPNNDGSVVVCAIQLALDLLDFSATKTSNGNRIFWKGIGDQNFSHYELEKLNTDARVFQTIGSNFAVQSENTEHTFEYLDNSSSNLYSDYYRLKMVDVDRSFTYSKIIGVLSSQKKSVSFNDYKDPNLLQVSIQNSDKSKHDYKLELVDIMGKSLTVLKKSGVGSNIEFDVPVSDLNSGIYFVLLSQDQNVLETFKWLKVQH